MEFVATTILTYASQTDLNRAFVDIPWHDFLEVLGGTDPNLDVIADLNIVRHWTNMDNAQQYHGWISGQLAQLGIIPTSFTVGPYNPNA